MKKVFFSVALVAAFGLTSCGGPDLCECMTSEEPSEACVEMAKEKQKEYEEADDEGKKKLTEEWAKEAEGCEKDGGDEEK